MKHTWVAAASVVLSLLSACGGGGGGGTSGATPARVDITTPAVLLTETGQSKALSARVLDSTGREITATVSWESTQPGQISVNAAGQVTALGDGGSGQITARVGDVRSAPLVVFHSRVPAGTLLLTDAQIVGEPVETSPDAAPGTDNTYSVRLSGVAAPAVGQLVLNTEAKIVVGRVQAVSTDASGLHTVTLGLVPLREVLPTLRVDETLDLSQAPVTVPADVLARYDVAREGTRYTFTPKVAVAAVRAAAAPGVGGGQVRAAAASGTSALPPFKGCELTIEGAGGAGSLPVQLARVPGFTVEFKPALDMVHTPEGGLERLVLSTEPTVTTDLSLEFTAGFDGKLTCGIDLLVVRIPTPGPVAAFLGGLVTLGAGMELSGKMALPGVKLGSVTRRATTLDVGLSCPPGGGCSLVHEAGAGTVTSQATVDGPDLADGRLEPSLFGYGKVQASIGNPFFTSLRFDAFYAKLGVALQSSLASREGQIADADYQSRYGVSALLKAGLDTGFEGLAAWLGLNGGAENLVELDAPLARSPAGALSLAQDTFNAGDRVEASIQFTDGFTFLGVYNIDEVILMRKVGAAAAREVARATLGDGLVQASLSFVAESNGTASELYAFVTTRALPAHPLELAQVPMSGRISAGGRHVCALTPAAGVKCWGGNPHGQLGNGTTAGSSTPQAVVGLASGVVAIGAGGDSTCAVTRAGAVKCWGLNRDGRLGNGNTTDSLVPAEVVGLGRGVVAVSVGTDHACALTQAGAVWCWGSNAFGQLGNSSVAHHSHTPVEVAGLGGPAVAISAGFANTCAVTRGGGLKCWGSNSQGELGNGSTTSSAEPVDVGGLGTGVAAVSTTANSVCALTRAGAVKCWGLNQHGELGNPTHDPGLGISSTPLDVAGMDSGVRAVSAGNGYACAIVSGGAARCWGMNPSGALGHGTSAVISTSPVPVSGLDGRVLQISAGAAFNCALLSGGAVRCWGYNRDGALGNGSTTNSNVPVDVIGFP